jgi:EAL domain-containing protein (putative c-di-GMP-specific phosphodiesterase class I)
VLERALGREDEPTAGDLRRLVVPADAAHLERLLKAAADLGHAEGRLRLRHRTGHHVPAALVLDRVEDGDHGDLLLLRADLGPAEPPAGPSRPPGLVLHAQPIVALGRPAAATTRFELLLRVTGEDGALLAPAAFLAQAEEEGRIALVDAWVAEQAIRLLHADRAARGSLELACNVSATTLQDPRFADRLEALLHERPVRPGSLTLEVTETAALRSLDAVSAVSARARALGCRLALDDFGAGFAGFLHLKQLELDVVKLDRALVGDVGERAADRRLVAAIVALAASLGVELIAEGIEDAATADALAGLGVPTGQGFHFGRPGPLPGR